MIRADKRGFTLVEVTIVMAVSSLLIAAAITGIGAIRDGNSSMTEVDELKNKIEGVRAEALSGITGTGTGQSTSTVFGKVMEFDPATPNQIRVSALIAADGDATSTLSRCEEAPLQIGQGMQYASAERQAVIFTRQPDRVFAVRGNYPDTASTCPQITFTNSTLETGQDGPPPPPAPPGPPAGGAPPPTTTPTAPSGQRKAMWQLWNNVLSHHEYTTSTAERDQKVNNENYVLQNGGNPIGYLYVAQVEGSVPFYRLYSPSQTATFYTRDIAERNLKMTQGYNYLGVEGYVLPEVYSGSIPLYQVYSSTYPDYYYSQDYNSILLALASFRGYSNPQTAAYLMSHPILSSRPPAQLDSRLGLSEPASSHGVFSVIQQLLGIGQAQAAFVFTDNILNPANYNLDNPNFANPVQLDFRFTGETGGRTGTIRVNPQNNQLTRGLTF